MKRIKMLLYGEPGTGKSVWASKAPKPFFITTDGNYEWLEDFGADPNAHKQVASWDEAKKVFDGDFEGYETIVVDLLEDMFKWCEAEFCKRSKIEHVSDIGYGKGYDISRNEFFVELCKLLAKDKHVIFLCHGITFTVKDRRGVEHTKYAPSNRIPDKVMDMIEGRMRYCLRCYMKAEEQGDGTVLKKRYLSLIPKENEFGIARGLDESQVPHDIPLEFSEFAHYIGIDMNATSAPVVEAPKTEEAPKRGRGKKVELEPEPVPEAPVETSVKTTGQELAEANNEDSLPWEEPAKTVEPAHAVVEQPVEKPVVPAQPVQPTTNADKIAAIKAKLAAMKTNK